MFALLSLALTIPQIHAVKIGVLHSLSGKPWPYLKLL